MFQQLKFAHLCVAFLHDLFAARNVEYSCDFFIHGPLPQSARHRDDVPTWKQGGTDEEILEWCFEKGRRLNDGDLFVWNGFASKLGWRDSVTPRLEQRKREHGIADRDDICTIPDLIDFDEGRIS